MHEIETLVLLDEESPLMKNDGIRVEEGIVVSYSNDLERYIVSVGKALSSLSSSLDKALLTLSLLEYQHLEQITYGNDQEKSAYIELLIENSIIRVQSIYDRVLIFTNRLLDLGMSNESIGHNALVTNDHVKAYGLDTKLKAVNRLCNEYRNIRNTVIHHDRFSDEELDRLTMVLQAESLSQRIKGTGVIDPELLNQVTENYLTTKQEELVDYLSKIQGKVSELLTEAVKIYPHKKDQLRKQI
ncbi:Cthe_2314 family HEPN domain-containing protein [Vibrio sp. SNU_ST1]|uniref:Cthe_2314 family HEPN domain-containing protein n=1 Tax=Vibrio sp. SNU_ST1 TaxID=3064001 RepID=UPI00272D2744|nr:Cthe_2314 family HEPN domain-containing protein [Vibrio sp. SNU_ST1]WKY60119.1 Cthe_2314 family HEPN domain-containing protein [Vibrio sp. SNU_ST1]